jgi:predicted transcriptional regulator
MDTDKLIATGLNEQQALAYALLIEAGEITPPEAAKKLNLTRSNTYKVLDRLVELGLANRTEKSKKLTYFPTNPSALTRLAAEQRNIATTRENAVQEVMSELISKYRTHTDQPNIEVVTGRNAVAAAYRAQIKQSATIYFLRSAADIASMSYETMHSIRVEPSRFNIERYGITPDNSTKPGRDTTLERTWVRGEDYDAPVEWSVAGESLLIVLFGDEPHAITIESPIVADAFRQIWQILNNCLRMMPYYKDLPRNST